MDQNLCILPIKSVPNGDHDFSFKAGRDVFAAIEGALIENGNLDVLVHVHKMDQMATLDFEISGSIEAQCDICLGKFDYPIDDCQGQITLRFGDHFEEVNEVLYEIDELEESIDLGQWIYEFVVVSLPIRFEHPLDDDGNSTCDPDMLDELDKYLVDESAEVGLSHKKDDNQTDPRWDALKSLLNK